MATNLLPTYNNDNDATNARSNVYQGAVSVCNVLVFFDTEYTIMMHGHEPPNLMASAYVFFHHMW